MKIYVQPADESSDIEDEIEIFRKGAESLAKPVKELLTRMIKLTSAIKNNYISSASELLKYKYMWALRSVEKEIDEEGGMIIIKLDGKNEIRDFSAELKTKINDLLLEFSK
jgi:hypothetical protein